MAITFIGGPMSGLWPLGFFTVAAAGTVVNLNSVVGPQTGSSATPSRLFRGIRVIVPSGSAGNIFLVRRVKGQTVSAAGTPNFVLGIVYPGTNELYTCDGIGSLINIDDYCLDTDAAGATCYVSGIYG